MRSQSKNVKKPSREKHSTNANELRVLTLAGKTKGTADGKEGGRGQVNINR